MREVASAATVAARATVWASANSPKFGMLIEKRIITRPTVVGRTGSCRPGEVYLHFDELVPAARRTLSWTCPRRSPSSTTARPNSRLKINGELVILGADGRLSFDALQQRLVTSAAKARAKAAELPASFAAFDLLAAGGVDLRTQRWAVRRERLEQVSRGWVPYPG